MRFVQRLLATLDIYLRHQISAVYTAINNYIRNEFGALTGPLCPTNLKDQQMHCLQQITVELDINFESHMGNILQQIKEVFDLVLKHRQVQLIRQTVVLLF